MKTKLILISSLFALTGCSFSEEYPDSCEGERFGVEVTSAVEVLTRTTLEGTSLSWAEGDKIGMFVEGIHYNQPFVNRGGESFAGSLVRTGRTEPSVRYAAYYPYVYCGESADGRVWATLPQMQRAPFDPSANFMMASVLDAPYDESNMPDISFAFDRQLFTIVKITVTNGNPDLQSEELVGVELSVAGQTLSGMFYFEPYGDTQAVIFSTDESAVSDKVSVTYPERERPVLGLGVQHVLYAVVNSCGIASGIKLVVKTGSHVVVTEATQDVSLAQGDMVSLPVVDIGSLPMVDRVRTVVLWGDSITSETLAAYMQDILGSDWRVVRGGVPGDTPHGIAGRQGGAPMCVRNSFTIPATTEKVEAGRLYSTLDMAGEYNPGSVALGSSYWFDPGNCALLNPCRINGVECEMSYDPNSGKYYLSRLVQGSPTTVEANTVIESYGSQRYRNADVIVTYMGANGSTPYETLARLYKEMAEYSSRKRHIVVGFHMAHISFPSGSERDYWTPAYRELFLERFGENFLDLRTVGNANAERLLLQTGAVYDPADITEADRKAIADGDWPASFSTDYLTNVHPNIYGIKALAILVKDKMDSLGYLDY